jgi:hypothetical protein
MGSERWKERWMGSWFKYPERRGALTRGRHYGLIREEKGTKDSSG